MNRLWQAYKYTFYWLYTWQKKLWGEEDFPQYTVIFGLSLSFIAIIVFFITLIYLLFGIFMFPRVMPNKITLLIYILLPVLIHYLLFIRKGYYKEIVREYSKESKGERKRKGKWVLLYTFGTLVLMILLPLIAYLMNK